MRSTLTRARFRPPADIAIFVVISSTTTTMLPTRMISTHPDLTCLILNSGIQRPLDFTQPSSISLDAVSLEFTTNYLSYVHFLRWFLPHFQQEKREVETKVVLVGSVLGLVPMTRCPNYCASKVRPPCSFLSSVSFLFIWGCR